MFHICFTFKAKAGEVCSYSVKTGEYSVVWGLSRLALYWKFPLSEIYCHRPKKEVRKALYTGCYDTLTGCNDIMWQEKECVNVKQEESTLISYPMEVRNLLVVFFVLWLWRRLGVTALRVCFSGTKIAQRCDQNLWILVINSKGKFCWRIKISFKYQQEYILATS